MWVFCRAVYRCQLLLRPHFAGNGGHSSVNNITDLRGSTIHEYTQLLSELKTEGNESLRLFAPLRWWFGCVCLALGIMCPSSACCVSRGWWFGKWCLSLPVFTHHLTYSCQETYYSTRCGLMEINGGIRRRRLQGFRLVRREAGGMLRMVEGMEVSWRRPI